MMMSMSRLIGTAALAAGLVLTGCGGATPDGRSQYEREGDFAKGNPDAPLTIIEYASTACPACAYYHANGKPTMDRYVESGQVRYVFREMITGLPALATPGFMLARCAPEERYFDVLDLLFAQQQALGRRAANRVRAAPRRSSAPSRAPQASATPSSRPA